ncbi:MAG: LacI family DNA-binding transcriptional regulator, partial [Propionibacteriaceae bacterium]
MRATIKDVARRAGVSPKTVSDVMNLTSPVTPPVRARVEEAIATLGYVPNLSARGLRNGRTGLIALALPDLSTWYSAEMAHHFVQAAGRRGLSVQIEETGISGDRERQLVSRTRAHLIDGL